MNHWVLFACAWIAIIMGQIDRYKFDGEDSPIWFSVAFILLSLSLSIGVERLLK